MAFVWGALAVAVRRRYRGSIAAFVLAAVACILPTHTEANGSTGAPQIAISDIGSTVAAVTVETSGNVKPDVVERYLTVRAGDRLEQSAIDRDYSNLANLAGLRARLDVKHNGTNAVTLHWIVASRRIAPANYSFYAVAPLSPAIGGPAFSLTTSPLGRGRSNVAASIQFTQRGGLAVFYSVPLHLDPVRGRESNFVVDVAGLHTLYRADQPEPVNVYSWVTAFEAAYLLRATNGTQLQLGLRTQRSTSDGPTNITAPSVVDTYYSPTRNTVLEAGLSRGCPSPPKQWHPPYCTTQYRLEAFNAIGGLGATSEYQLYNADLAHYTAIGSSTLALHAAGAWTGGVLPTSLLVCSNLFHAYPKAFCGTSAQIVQAEFRIGDASPAPLKFIVFTETGASRVRGGDQPPFATSTYQWHADSGIGVMYRVVRLNLGYGSQGARLSFELQGQSF